MIKNYLFVLLLMFASCTNPVPSEKEIISVDLEFSATSAMNGFNKAFIEFAHDSAVLLRENSMPIVGKTVITDLFEKASSDGIEFTWKPLYGDIAKSGDLGYTYGVYTIKRDSLVEEGTYVSIWKKNQEGKWKYVLDTGNKGLGN